MFFFMKKLMVLFALVGLMVFSTKVQAQDSTDVSSNETVAVQRSYIRPTVTRIYVTDGSVAANQYAERFSQIAPSQYNYIELEKKSFTLYDIPANKKKRDKQVNKSLKNFMEAEKVGNQIMHGWFPEYDKERGTYSINKLREVGRYAMTDQDVLTANSGTRSVDVYAATFGKELIDRSYVICYLIAHEKNLGGESAVLKVTPYAYKLDYGKKVAANFQKNYFRSQDGIDECNFPLIHVMDAKKGFTASTGEDELAGTAVGIINLLKSAFHKKKNEAEVAQSIDESIEEDFDMAISRLRKVSELQPQATIESVKPIEANMGRKEGVHVDKRFDVIRLEERTVKDKNGNISVEQVEKVRAAVRAKKVVDNRGLATGDVAELSKFYKIRGYAIQEGYTLRQNPDRGVGIALEPLGVYPGVSIDYRIGRYVKVPGLLVGAKLSFPLYGAEFTGSQTMYSAGLAKEFNFAPFTITPGVDLGMWTGTADSKSDGNGGYSLYGGDDSEAECSCLTIGMNAKVGCYFTRSSQIYAVLGFVAPIKKPETEATFIPINVGLGLKFGF